MVKNASILLLLLAIVALPFLFRRSETASAWRKGDPEIVIVTPHNEAIRYEFEHAFSRWHQQKYGKPVRIEWRVIGGTTETMRYLASEYASAARAWWPRTTGKPWPANATETVTADKAPTDATLLEVYKKFRDTDDPAQFSARIDLFFGGGQFDHSNAFEQGMTVPPWKAGEEPKELFFENGVDLIPAKLAGETWRTPTLFGNVISTFGICYNVDRLRDLGITTPPREWKDLANPVYFGQVGTVDPTKSGSVAKAFENIIHQRIHDTVRAAGFDDKQIADYEAQIGAFSKSQGTKYKRGDLPPSVPPKYQDAIEQGWLDGVHLVQRIGANARYFTDSASKAPIDVSTGDAAVAMAIDFYGRFQAQNSQAPDGHDRMVYLTPAGGSSVSCDPISLLRGAGGSASGAEAQKETRAVAVRFIEFVLSEDGQKLWCYKPGEPASAGGPEKFALRRLPIRRDFYPSTNPTIQARHLEHLKHATDNLADPNVDAYTLAKAFVYYPRWTGSHFGFHRDLIRVMCLDAGDELKAAWFAINHTTDPQRRAKALEQLGQFPEVALTNKAKEKEPVKITWRTAPDIGKKYDKLEYTREWTIFFRDSYRKAKELAQ